MASSFRYKDVTLAGASQSGSDIELILQPGWVPGLLCMSFLSSIPASATNVGEGMQVHLANRPISPYQRLVASPEPEITFKSTVNGKRRISQ